MTEKRKRPDLTVVTRSPEETARFGRKLSRTIPVPGVVSLCGSLGTGKTTLMRGIAQGLGLEDPSEVHSPSFTLVNVYRGRCPIYHVDLYRLAGRRDLDSIGLDDFLGSDGVTVVEWGERLPSWNEADVLVELEDAGGDERIVRVYRNSPPRRRKPDYRKERS